MLKNWMKNVILACSVLLAFVLLYQIWFGGYFLPQDNDYISSTVQTYFVNPVLNLFKKDKEADFSQNLNALLKPEKIVVNIAGERRVFGYGAAGFSETYTYATGIFSEFISGNAILISKETVDNDAYASVLKGRSIYVDYGKACDFRLVSFAVHGLSNNAYTSDLNAITGYIINLHDTILDRPSIFVKDEKSGNIYKYIVEMEDTISIEQLREIVDATPVTTAFSYSFELNFHKQQAEQRSKLLFEPSILIELISPQLPSAEGQALMSFDQDYHYDYEESILNSFAINTRTTGQYIDLNNRKIFVANNATLTLYPDGYLEYQAVEGGRGLDISGESDKSHYDIYKATANAVDFVTDISACFPATFFEHLQINSELTDNALKEGVYTICFDYFHAGVPVLHQKESEPVHTIEMEIENGYLKSYRQFTKIYESIEGQTVLQPVISAADTLVDMLYQNEVPLEIKKVGLCYLDAPGSVVEPFWNFHVNGVDKMIR